MKSLIYIVEDDEGIRAVYEGAFEGIYKVKSFERASDFFEEYEKVQPDLVILDLMLPDMDGNAILKKIRETNERMPVIIVSAKTDETSFVDGLNDGADDYMAKPFSVKELIARVNTNLRRASLYFTQAEGFTLDSNLFKAFYQGKDLGLTLKEFNLLKTLVQKGGRTVTREELFKDVWGENFIGETRTVDVHVASLRDKINGAGGVNKIVTVRGVGYRFEN
ncbi:MAG: response regulator transcription factor [Clostridia bacterium]|nr:response regulator transcription factor [Clostridia bacterium]